MEEENQKCSICQVNKFKYTCPQCLQKTCSLSCFNTHKYQANCPGKSDVSMNRVKYKPRKEIEGTDVQRDFNFLNRLSRERDLGKSDVKSNKLLSLKRSYNRANGRSNNNTANKRRAIDDESNIIIKRDVKLRQLPNGMSRRTTNRSAFDPKKKKFMWTLDWLLVDGDLKTINKFTSFKNGEDLKLGELVPVRRFLRCLEQTPYSSFEQLKKEVEIATEKEQESLEEKLKIQVVETSKVPVVANDADSLVKHDDSNELKNQEPTITNEPEHLDDDVKPTENRTEQASHIIETTDKIHSKVSDKLQSNNDQIPNSTDTPKATENKEEKQISHKAGFEANQQAKDID
ncbi:unnamed protein product [Ambrosiozyma monospora]|uniref:Unnamed protein product n=1 Tax=Ambrosiozyma monospora TaxID=43982 RepID=A0ACB5T5E7_AMBMO|nr:unnamed protein product [Ambrosiozyma monospora]